MRRRRTWTIVAASVGGTLAVLAIAALVLIYSGGYNVAASDEHNPVVRWALSTATDNSIEAHAGGPIELPTGAAAHARGFQAYDAMCVQCHGAPGVERGWIGQGIRPTGPDLAETAAELSPAEILWTLEHGIKFTGMPALGPTHSRDELLELTAFVVGLKDMSAGDYGAMRAEAGPVSRGRSPEPEHAEPSGHDHEHSHGR